MVRPIALAMAGVCLTGIGLPVDALPFPIATLGSCFALRMQGTVRLHRLGRIADATFILAMPLLTAACFIVTCSLDRQPAPPVVPGLARGDVGR